MKTAFTDGTELNQLTILKLAYRGAMEIWEKRFDRLEKNPETKVLIKRFKEIDAIVNAIEEMILEEELNK